MSSPKTFGIVSVSCARDSNGAVESLVFVGYGRVLRSDLTLAARRGGPLGVGKPTLGTFAFAQHARGCDPCLELPENRANISN
jgi:hypothetical protein